jgi:hypothetical protein
VATLMRPPGDLFHERLVAAYPQITRFLPRSIAAVELQAIDSAAPVLGAYHAPGKWLIGKPRTTRRPAEEVPLEVITAVVAVPRARPADDAVDHADYLSARSFCRQQVGRRHPIMVIRATGAPQNRSPAGSRACAGSGQPLPSPSIALLRVRASRQLRATPGRESPASGEDSSPRSRRLCARRSGVEA